MFDFQRLLAAPDAPRKLLAAFGFDDWLPLEPTMLDRIFASSRADVAAVTLAGERGSVAAACITLNAAVEPRSIARVTRDIRLHAATRPWLLVVTGTDAPTISIASVGIGDDVRTLTIERNALRAHEIETLRELVPPEGCGGVELALRHTRALDRSRVSQRFFRDVKAHRAALADAWTGLPRSARHERDQLALLQLCRLMFLYFLQKRGHLAGNLEYMRDLLITFDAQRTRASFYRSRLRPLFFAVLNTLPEKRSRAALKLGDLPYLNGGLFEMHALEHRFRKLDAPDVTSRAIFEDLLERYRFTTFDPADTLTDGVRDSGIDPEMLGRVFEALMQEDVRGGTGSFYTPPAVVDRLVHEGLVALLASRLGMPLWQARQCAHGEIATKGLRREVDHLARTLRVIDPACGSGAFLLGALARIAALRTHGDHDPVALRRDIVGNALHGVDLLDDAALLCALRLWLALLPENGSAPQPLPNLDRRIRQGDALLDPFDLALQSRDASHTAARDRDVRAAVAALRPASQRYLTAGPEEKPRLRQLIRDAETRLARAWKTAVLRHFDRDLREIRALLGEVDLFGKVTERAEAAAAQHQRLLAARSRFEQTARDITDRRALPFFSFNIHFPEAGLGGFDLVVSNPPWVRSHRWPAAMSRLIRDQYTVCRSPQWAPPSGQTRARRAGQVDLAVLFFERSVKLLNDGCALAMLLPAKFLRSLYATGARRLALRELRIASIEDHSLDQRSIFQADAFTAALVATRQPPAPKQPIEVRVFRRGVPPLSFTIGCDDLPLIPGDDTAPWVIAPPDVLRAIRRMQAAGPCIAQHPDLQPHRGVFTGANDVLLATHVEPKLGNLAHVTFERPDSGAKPGSAYLEDAVLRPLVRGQDIRAWSFQTERAILFCHDDAGRLITPPKRVQRYLQRHAARLRARAEWKPFLPLGAIFRVAAHTFGHRIAWHDLAADLHAAVLPATVDAWGSSRALIPLNTVYYLRPRTEREAYILAAYLNSLPVRTFARVIAERAKDAHFRFFAWTVGCLPLPHDWHRLNADEIERISRRAHAQRGIEPDDQVRLDHIIATAYHLDEAARNALASYDRWLRGLETA